MTNNQIIFGGKSKYQLYKMAIFGLHRIYNVHPMEKLAKKQIGRPLEFDRLMNCRYTHDTKNISAHHTM